MFDYTKEFNFYVTIISNISALIILIDMFLFYFFLVYRMDQNQIITIMARLWKREVSRTAQNIVALRRLKRKPRKSFLTVSISLNIKSFF